MDGYWGGIDLGDCFEMPELFEKTEATVFHIGQTYAKEPIPTFRCKKCGSDQFHVGYAEYFTGIKCPVCDWEVVIHDG